LQQKLHKVCKYTPKNI